MKTEKEKMLAGELSDPLDPVLCRERQEARDLCQGLNTLREDQTDFNCVVLDVMAVKIGDNVLFGPAVQIYTATHPISAVERRSWLELARPVTIGSGVWIGGGAIVCPGVTIGSRSVINAGSVVTRDIPDDAVAAGNPCRVIRSLASNP